MKVLIPGHKYSLDNLKSEGEQILNFFMDPEIHDQEQLGTSCQEVIRALIDRVKRLDEEKPHFVNSKIIRNLRQCIVFFEMRALLNKVADNFEVEHIPILPDGHIDFLNKNEEVLKALDFIHAYIDSSKSEVEEKNLNFTEILSKARSLRDKVDPIENRQKRLETLFEDISSYKGS